ncbi:putative Mg2+ transporter-C (MgtC) family protein [Fusobacterium naviforme]|uniref:Mg2+ transporter-C (MgtC) family protein n=1 Tax=Moryella indoligenes TaxID=371674 RepID=A0AAE3VAK4_9FIRM|nr:MgtC/SapB family protein [Moryella indoligenes]KAB0577162.1 MgtC/SapB family protein [Fusobacterium naviforme]MDQ0152655.1 putative Mg2+ transporter-C (MgtC) family protein [Moryella indoligenes]PSL10120.1 putative Mg2+ transporter-C (MgtC) family protein [Fusobacterium naviforme]STO27529.1 putative Mg(2+) transport ATPase [Fusobacterium naviforme]
MDYVMTGLRDLTTLSICLRMILSVLCGGAVGLEREYKRRSAGFRTHILITLGACVTTLTGQYLSIYMHYFTDMARLGAQVVAGIGFIGAGAIIRTQGNQVRGLTTSAGLWASGIIGLCFGAGFFEGGLITTALILLSEIVFSKLEYWMRDHAPEVTLYIEYKGRSTMELLTKNLQEMAVKLKRIEISRSGETGENGKRNLCAVLTLQLNRDHDTERLLEYISMTDGVVEVEEL